MTLENITSAALLKDRARGMIRAAGCIEKDTLSRELKLTTSKWFDYRFMSPVQATRIFAEACERRFRDKWGADWNCKEPVSSGTLPAAPRSPGLSFADFWRARQDADMFGLPYPFFVRVSIEEAFKWRPNRSPQPHQVFRKDYSFACINRILDKWDAYRKHECRMVSALPQYRNEVFSGLSAQIAHRRWVLDDTKFRYSDPYWIGHSIYIDRLIPLEMAATRYDNEHLERAAAYVERDTPVEAAIVTESDYWPSCFMVPHAIEHGSPGCSVCPVADRCATGERVVRDALVRLHGTDHPAGTGKRRIARRRKHRKKAA